MTLQYTEVCYIMQYIHKIANLHYTARFVPVNFPDPIFQAPSRSLDDAGQSFSDFAASGQDFLASHRDRLISPDSHKSLRTFGMNEASKLIGRSSTWIRKIESERNGSADDESIDGKRQPARSYTLVDINELRSLAGTLYKRPLGSKAIVMAVSNFKGGVAKTTTTIHLAQKCAIEGLKVLVLDFDPQASCSFSLGNAVPDVEIKDDQTISQALLDNPTAIKDVIQRTYFHGVDIVHANLSLSMTELEIANPDLNNSKKLGAAGSRLSSALSYIRDDYDVILIDCGPNLGPLTINALMAANALLVPVPPAMLDLASMVSFMSTLEKLFEHIGHGLDFFSIVLTKHPQSSQSQVVEAKMRQLFAGHCLSNYMAMTVELERTSSAMGTIYDTSKPKSNRDTYQRALSYADAVNTEIIDGFKQIWDLEAARASLPATSA